MDPRSNQMDQQLPPNQRPDMTQGLHMPLNPVQFPGQPPPVHLGSLQMLQQTQPQTAQPRPGFQPAGINSGGFPIAMQQPQVPQMAYGGQPQMNMHIGGHPQYAINPQQPQYQIPPHPVYQQDMASFQNAQGQFVGYNQSPQHFVGQPSVPSLSPQVGYQHASGGLATGQVPNLPMSGNLNPGMVPNLPISTNLNPGPTVNQPADPTISANAYSNGPQQMASEESPALGPQSAIPSTSMTGQSVPPEPALVPGRQYGGPMFYPPQMGQQPINTTNQGQASVPPPVQQNAAGFSSSHLHQNAMLQGQVPSSQRTYPEKGTGFPQWQEQPPAPSRNEIFNQTKPEDEQNPKSDPSPQWSHAFSDHQRIAEPFHDGPPEKSERSSTTDENSDSRIQNSLLAPQTGKRPFAEEFTDRLEQMPRDRKEAFLKLAFEKIEKLHGRKKLLEALNSTFGKEQVEAAKLNVMQRKQI